MPTSTVPPPMRAEDRGWIIEMALTGYAHLAAQGEDCLCQLCENPDGVPRVEALTALVAAFRQSGSEGSIDDEAPAAMPVHRFTDEERRVVVLAAKTYLVNAGEIVPN